MTTNAAAAHATRIARTLDDVAEGLRPTLAVCAAESCRLMLANGWDPAGDTYEIGAMPGDRQTAEEQIGRALTPAEVRALELCIRAHLAAARLRWDLVPMFDDDGEALTRDERIRALREYRSTGAMLGIYFTTAGDSPEERDAAACEGPAVDEIDWATFPEVTAEDVTTAARAAFAASKLAGNDDGAAFEDVNEVVKALVGSRTGTLDQETLTWTFDASPAVDLWEDNAGGLALVCRATGAGFCGLERGQNVARLRAAGRDEFTFASDATPDNFAELGEGSLYDAMPADEVEALYEREGEANADVRVRILCGVAAGSAVELRPDVPITITEARALVGPAAAARVVALPALRAHKLRAVPVA